MADFNVEILRNAISNGENVQDIIDQMVNENKDIKSIDIVYGGAELPDIVIEYHQDNPPDVYFDGQGHSYRL